MCLADTSTIFHTHDQILLNQLLGDQKRPSLFLLDTLHFIVAINGIRHLTRFYFDVSPVSDVFIHSSFIPILGRVGPSLNRWGRRNRNWSCDFSDGSYSEVNCEARWFRTVEIIVAKNFF